MSRYRTALLFCTAIVWTAIVAACGASPPPAGEPDAGPMMLVDAGPPPDGCGPPSEPYGTSEGRNFRPFTLNRCDGTPFSFYGEAEGFCDASFTVLTMAAGWCGPCIVESQQLEERLVQAYADERVRVIQVLIQDDNYEAPSGAFCQSRVDRFGLTNPVLVDPEQITQVYFPAGSLPATLIVDAAGVIRHREYGTSTGLATITAALDRLLAGRR